ncbi:hypothetical protein QJQ45_028425, partial [Haematococcus lacustris]
AVEESGVNRQGTRALSALLVTPLPHHPGSALQGQAGTPAAQHATHHTHPSPSPSPNSELDSLSRSSSPTNDLHSTTTTVAASSSSSTLGASSSMESSSSSSSSGPDAWAVVSSKVSAKPQQGAAGVWAPCTVTVFGFEDLVQPGTAAAVAALQHGAWRRPGSGLAWPGDRKRVVLLTGDNQAVAAHVAASVGISQVMAGLKPEDKLQWVQAHGEQAKARAEATKSGSQPGLVMMGDGINDAPALAAAHVGIALAASPADMVASAADIIILNGRGVANLPWLFAVARKTQVVVRQ